MDVDKLIWCLQNGSDVAKAKLKSLLNTVNSVIEADVVNADSNVEKNGCYLNGNHQKAKKSELPINKSDCVLVDSERDVFDDIIEYDPLEEAIVNNRIKLDGNPFFLHKDQPLSLVVCLNEVYDASTSPGDKICAGNVDNGEVILFFF